jgi:hypothetical protein
MQVVHVPEEKKRREREGGVKAHQPLGEEKETNPPHE